MIEVQNVTKRYGKHLAVDRVTFNVNQGEILGFLGPNGAGKTTTMNIISGFISMTEGSVRVAGMDVLEHPEEIKRKIGYLPEHPPLYGEMTVNEYLLFVSRVKGVKRSQRKGEIDHATERVGIVDHRKRLINNLSKGYRQRVGLAQALIGNPDVMILDEPTIGLDPKQIIDIRNLIQDLGKSHTIILSSHILPEVSAVCERVVIIHHGRIRASDNPENLAHHLGAGHSIVVRIPNNAGQPETLLRGIDGVNDLRSAGELEPGTFDVVIRASRDIRREVFAALSEAAVPLLMMKPLDYSLEEIFLQVTKDEEEEADVSRVS